MTVRRHFVRSSDIQRFISNATNKNLIQYDEEGNPNHEGIPGFVQSGEYPESNVELTHRIHFRRRYPHGILAAVPARMAYLCNHDEETQHKLYNAGILLMDKLGHGEYVWRITIEPALRAGLRGKRMVTQISFDIEQAHGLHPGDYERYRLPVVSLDEDLAKSAETTRELLAAYLIEVYHAVPIRRDSAFVQWEYGSKPNQRPASYDEVRASIVTSLTTPEAKVTLGAGTIRTSKFQDGKIVGWHQYVGRYEKDAE